jgi:hypothetical protein
LAKKKTNYINAHELHEALTNYYIILRQAKEEKSTLPRVPEQIGVYIMRICNELSTWSKFARYTFKDEMVEDAIMNCVYGASMFNPTKPTANAFNYMTTIAYQSFLQRIDKEKRQHYIRHSNFVKNFSDIDGNLLEIDGEVNEVSNRVVQEFEAKQLERKRKQAEKKRKNAKK